jgi:hypothetical protein
VFIRKYEQAPPNPTGVPRGLVWYTVTETDRKGHVLAYEMTENASPPMGDRLRLALTQGIALPEDKQATSLNSDTCIVVKSATLKRLTGDAYAASTTATGTTTADIRVENSPAC